MGKYTVFMKQTMTDILRSHKKKVKRLIQAKSKVEGGQYRKKQKNSRVDAKRQRQTESPKRDEPNEH